MCGDIFNIIHYDDAQYSVSGSSVVEDAPGIHNLWEHLQQSGLTQSNGLEAMKAILPSFINYACTGDPFIPVEGEACSEMSALAAAVDGSDGSCTLEFISASEDSAKEYEQLLLQLEKDEQVQIPTSCRFASLLFFRLYCCYDSYQRNSSILFIDDLNSQFHRMTDVTIPSCFMLPSTGCTFEKNTAEDRTLPTVFAASCRFLR